MTQTTTHPSNTRHRLRDWLPNTVNHTVRILAWLSLAMQITLIGTGGAVRLTASGLGCPTWPLCSSSSLIPTPALGIHGIIEFGNRMLTGVLVLVVVAMLLSVLRSRKLRRDIFVLALVQFALVAVQAVVGGITVKTGLGPYVVGSHYLLSIVLVILTTNLVYRVYNGRRGSERLTPRWYVALSILTAVVVGITVIFGVLTSGAGPHAGDNSNAKALAPRNGLDPALLQYIHSIPAYTTFGLTVLLVIIAVAARERTRWRCVRVFSLGLLGVEFVQIIVGYVQAKEGLPVALVNIHLVLAAILVAAIAALLLSLRGSGR